MRVNTFLITKMAGQTPKPLDLTAVDLRELIGCDMEDGTVLMSKDTWKRLELFIDILKSVDFLCYEDAIDDVLKRWHGELNAKSIQPEVAGASESEVGSTEAGAAGNDGEAHALSSVRKALSFGGANLPPQRLP
jgi:hypothetical protein